MTGAFAAFERRIGQRWKTADFNKGWYREAVGKATVFRAAERVVTDQS